MVPGRSNAVPRDGGKAEIDVLRAMCDVIEHRGPDGEGLLVEGPYAFGMRCIAIIDVGVGDRPTHTAGVRHGRRVSSCATWTWRSLDYSNPNVVCEIVGSVRRREATLMDEEDANS